MVLGSHQRLWNKEVIGQSRVLYSHFGSSVWGGFAQAEGRQVGRVGEEGCGGQSAVASQLCSLSDAFRLVILATPIQAGGAATGSGGGVRGGAGPAIASGVKMSYWPCWTDFGETPSGDSVGSKQNLFLKKEEMALRGASELSKITQVQGWLS